MELKFINPWASPPLGGSMLSWVAGDERRKGSDVGATGELVFDCLLLWRHSAEEIRSFARARRKTPEVQTNAAEAPVLALMTDDERLDSAYRDLLEAAGVLLIDIPAKYREKSEEEISAFIDGRFKGPDRVITQTPHSVGHGRRTRSVDPSLPFRTPHVPLSDAERRHYLDALNRADPDDDGVR